MKPRLAVHKFSSCDGCQLSLLNLGDGLLELAEAVKVVHFAEAGMLDEQAHVDVAIVEGSISTPHELERIQRVRERSRFLMTIGACATAGGLQALRNHGDSSDWLGAVYASPQYVESLATSTAIADHVKVDFELWGCPVNGHQVLAAVKSLLLGVVPPVELERVCQSCKRQNQVCVMVTRGLPCMGPVTQNGCGALCPSIGRDCFACYGPVENAATAALASRFAELGLDNRTIGDRFLFINNNAPAFRDEGLKWRGEDDE